MRFRLPKNCAGITHGGVTLDQAADGTVEADQGATDALAPHGLVPIDLDVPVGKPSRARAKSGNPRSGDPRSDDPRMLR